MRPGLAHRGDRDLGLRALGGLEARYVTATELMADGGLIAATR